MGGPTTSSGLTPLTVSPFFSMAISLPSETPRDLALGASILPGLHLSRTTYPTDAMPWSVA